MTKQLYLTLLYSIPIGILGATSFFSIWQIVVLAAVSATVHAAIYVALQ